MQGNIQKSMTISGGSEAVMDFIHNFDEPVVRRDTDAKKYLGFSDDVLPMWIADTDFRSPQPVIDACVARMKEGVYGYPGISKAFKKAVSFWLSTRFHFDVAASAVEFVPGVIPGIICAIRALSHPGDYVAMLTPTYPPFKDLIDHNGRLELRSPLKIENGRYEIDFEDLESKLSLERCRLFLLCNPHNPSGRVFTMEELRKIEELCRKHHVIVLADEIHQDLIYKGSKHIPFASVSDWSAANSIVFINASKTFNTAGFRTAAFYTLNPDLKNRTHEEILNNKGIGENLCGTVATIAAYTQCAYYADQMMGYVEENLKMVTDWLDTTDQISMIQPEGTYLLWLNCKNMGLSQKELTKFFAEKAKVYLNDGASFGPEGAGYMRMNIATTRKNVQEALRRISAALCK